MNWSLIIAILLDVFLIGSHRVLSADSKCNELYPPSSKGETHTLCLPPSKLNLTPKNYVVPVSDQKIIVEAHNMYRSKASKPTAANMESMVYDDELAKTAQAWAERCQVGHDKYRYSYAYNTMPGQNAAYGLKTWEISVFKWWDEIRYFTYGNSTGIGGNVIGHFTQVMQANSVKIGCGYARCKTKYRYHYICNYIVGNMRIAEPYKSGATCADCPNSCNNGLCDCNGLECFNGGTKDIDACKCTCRPENYGRQCLQEKCPGLKCLNYGDIDVQSCTCKCYGRVYSGSRCETKKCPSMEERRCKSFKPEDCTKFWNVKHLCPYFCGLCTEKDRPSCENDKNCHKSPQGCVFYGKQASESMCKNYGKQGKDLTTCTNYGSRAWKCADCFKFSNVKTDFCPNMCGYCKNKCGNMKCKNGGYFDNEQCTCQCRKEFAGIDCSIQLCPNVKCKNGGKVNTQTCKCDCRSPFSGDSCEQKTCPFKEADRCTNKDDCKRYSNMKYDCPYLCGTCTESERLSCENDPTCYESRKGCYYFGKQASPEMCKRLGIKGRDHWICSNKPGDWTCQTCKKYSNVKTDYCPYMCGYCKDNCPGKDCQNGGTLDVSTCKCSCPFKYSGDRCEKELCPGINCENGGKLDLQSCTCKCHSLYQGQMCEIKFCPFRGESSCGSYWTFQDCKESSKLKFKCPYMCGLCVESERPTCEKDPNCYLSKKGCYYIGKPASPEKCKTLGVNGKDHWICSNNNNGWKCDSCITYSNVKTAYCPLMCGYCRE